MINPPSQKIEITGKRNPTSIATLVRVELNKYSIVPSNYFVVRLTPPRYLTERGLSDKGIITACMYRGNTAVIPGLQLNTSSIRRYTVGLEERNPISSAVIDQTFSFIGDNQGLIHGFFYRWLNSIVTSNKYDPIDNVTDSEWGVDRGRYPGSVLYKSEYASSIEVFVFSATPEGVDPTIDTGRLVHYIRFENAYPIAIGDTQLSWADNDSFIQFPVTFTYTHWQAELVGFEDDKILKPPRGGVKSLLSKGASAALLVSSLKKPRNIQDALSIVNNAKTVLGGFAGSNIYGG